MQSRDWDVLKDEQPELAKEISKHYEPVEYEGEKLRERLNELDKLTIFERRKEALKPQTKK